MDLELKHISAYFGHSIQMQFGSGNGLTKVGTWNAISHYEDATHPTRLKIDFGDYEHIWLFKPILYPLSAISKEITVNGKTFIPIVELLKIRYATWFEQKHGRYGKIEHDENSAWFAFQANFEIKILYFPNDIFSYPAHWIIEKFCEWHIDYQDLIGQGLAVEKK